MMDEDKTIDDIRIKEAVIDTIKRKNDSSYSYEPVPNVFHPSQVGKCKRQMFLSKLGQANLPVDVLGKFTVGTIIHSWLEENLSGTMARKGYNPEFETPVNFEEDGLKFKGQADMYDPDTNVVIDFKTRANFYHFNPPVQRHLDQIYTYMRGLDADKGKVLYLGKTDLELRDYPNDAVEPRFFDFNSSRWEYLKARCHQVRVAVKERVENREEGDYVRSIDDIPFEPCGECYVCRHEDEKIRNKEYKFLVDEEGE